MRQVQPLRIRGGDGEGAQVWEGETDTAGSLEELTLLAQLSLRGKLLLGRGNRKQKGIPHQHRHTAASAAPSDRQNLFGSGAGTRGSDPRLHLALASDSGQPLPHIGSHCSFVK